MKTKRNLSNAKLGRSVRIEKARKLYFDEKSTSYLKATDSLIAVGYTKKTARQMSYSNGLFDRVGEDTKIYPLKTDNLIEEISRWIRLMSNWRVSLEKVKDPMSINSKTYSVISSHIERLSKIAGFIKEGDTNVTVNISNLPHPELYDKLKMMVPILIEKIHFLEEEMNISDKFSLN